MFPPRNYTVKTDETAYCADLDIAVRNVFITMHHYYKLQFHQTRERKKIWCAWITRHNLTIDRRKKGRICAHCDTWMLRMIAVTYKTGERKMSFLFHVLVNRNVSQQPSYPIVIVIFCATNIEIGDNIANYCGKIWFSVLMIGSHII